VSNSCAYSKESVPPAEQIVVVVGFNELLGAMMVELDKTMGPRSKVIVHAPQPIAMREDFIARSEQRRKYSCKNIRFEHTLGPLGARFLLEELPLEKASTILILADNSMTEASAADAQSLAVVVQIQDILFRRKVPREKYPMILPQLLEEGSTVNRSPDGQSGAVLEPAAIGRAAKVSAKATEEILKSADIHDFMLTETLAARIMACVCEVPKLSTVMDCIVKERTCVLRIRDLWDYPAAERLDATAGVSFNDVTAVASCANEIVLGWSNPVGEADGDEDQKPWLMNPKNRDRKRTWPKDARLVVLHRNHDTALAPETTCS